MVECKGVCLGLCLRDRFVFGEYLVEWWGLCLREVLFQKVSTNQIEYQC